MNYIDFNQDGGFRLSTNILNAVQAAYSLFNALGFIAGDKTIITGCVVTGNNVSDGVVFLNGQVYTFKGGNLGTNVIVKETITSYPFQNGAVKPVLYDRYVGFGSGLPEETYLWADFKRTFQTKEIQAFKDSHNNRITALENRPSERIIGEVIRFDQPLVVLPPLGWVDHNPEEEQGKVWVARSTTDGDFRLGVTGGAKTTKLTPGQLPKMEGRFETLTGNSVVPLGVASYLYSTAALVSGGSTNFSHKGVKIAFGNDESQTNLQPYVGVRYIKYIGIQN